MPCTVCDILAGRLEEGAYRPTAAAHMMNDDMETAEKELSKGSSAFHKVCNALFRPVKNSVSAFTRNFPDAETDWKSPLIGWHTLTEAFPLGDLS
jgi:hypothetical protein